MRSVHPDDCREAAAEQGCDEGLGLYWLAYPGPITRAAGWGLLAAVVGGLLWLWS